jgi:hypothetical protein
MAKLAFAAPRGDTGAAGMRRTTQALLLGAALLAACGGAESKPASVRPTPDDGGVKAMTPGEYRTTVFRPEVRLRTRTRFWEREFETRDSFSLWSTDRGTAAAGDVWLHILRPHRLYDPANPRDGRPWPQDTVAFLQHHPDLETTEPEVTEVGGFPAKALDVRARRPTQLWVDSAEQLYEIHPGHGVRVYVIDAGDEQRLVVLTAYSDERAAALEPLDRIVRTLRFSDSGRAG